jgi:phosphatidylinositol glycan class B
MESESPAEGPPVQLTADSESGIAPGATDKPDSKRGSTKKTHSQMHAQVAAAQVHDVLSLLLAFRFLNALCLRTFFQPDEYFQALEPAWSIAFGSGSGAWLTWVNINLPLLFFFVP